MADFSKNIRIRIKLKKDGFDGLGEVASDLHEVSEKMGDLDDNLEEIGGSIDTFSGQLKDIDTSEIKQLADDADRVVAAKEEIAEMNKEVEKRNEKTKTTTLDEAKSFQELMDSADSLAEAKHAAGKANKQLSKRNEETAESALVESRALQRAGLSHRQAAEAAREMTSHLRDSEDEIDSNSKSLRRLRKRVGRSSEEMRAANKVGELFEDGLGSLSVNLGAFTVALRNFLTQVPLLVSALGALGAAAAGVAGSFLTAGTAIGSAIAAGAVGRAQQLKEEYEGIEELGQGFAVIFGTVRDMMLEAISPLTENAATFEIFKDTVEGTAEVIGQMAAEINSLMTDSDKLVRGAMSITEVFHTLGQELEGPINDVIAGSSRMFMLLQDEFIDMSVGMVEALAGLIRFSTDFANGITKAGGAVDTLTGSLAELAELGKTVFSGIAPIILGFFAALEKVAAVLNSVNHEVLAALITFGLVFAAVNKFGAALGSIITLIPNLVGAFLLADGSLSELLGTFRDFLSEQGGVLSGFISLIDSVDGLSEEFAILSLRMEVAESDMEDINREMAEMIIKGEVAEETMDELGEAGIDVDAHRGGGGVGGPMLLPGMEGVQKRVATAGKNVKGALTGGGITGFFTGLAGLIKSAAGTIAGALGGLTGPLLVLVAIIGGLLVGVITNFDEIMGALGATVNAVGSFFKWFAGLLVELSIAIWNTMADTLNSLKIILAATDSGLVSAGEGASFLGSVIDAIAGIIEFLVDILVAMFDALGMLIQFFATLIAVGLSVWNIINRIGRAIFEFLVVNILKLLGIWKPLNSVIDTSISTLGRWIDTIANMPAVAMEVFDLLRQGFQDFFNNTIIGGMNDVIRELNKLPGVNQELVEEVNFGTGGGEGLRVSGDELAADTESMFGSTEPEPRPQVNYNKFETQNVNQQIDADPEDKGSLSRVVKDAMEEANSFERRRQGFGG